MDTRKIRKKVTSLLIGFLMISSLISIQDIKAQEVSFIDIDLSGTLNGDDFAFAIDCNDQDFAYVTIFEQGLLAKVNKDTRAVEEIIDDPDGPVESGQRFTGITTDVNTGSKFISESTHGKAWRFDPFAAPEEAWTSIPLIAFIENENVNYPLGYETRPDLIEVNEGEEIGPVTYTFDVEERGGIVFANGFILVGITYNLDFDEFAEALGLEDISFSGIAVIDPNSFEVILIPIPDAVIIAGMSVDSLDPAIVLVTDLLADKVYAFDTNSFEVVQEFVLDAGSAPNHVASDADNIYVALNKVSEGEEFSEIAQINRSTLETTIINTGAPNTNLGTFSVFVSNDVLAWNDQSGHVGMFDLSSGVPVAVVDQTTGLPFITTGENDRHRLGCPLGNTSDFEFGIATEGSAKVTILSNPDFSSGGVKKLTDVASITFVNVDLSNTLNPEDFPFGIECGDPQFVYVTIFEQGLLAKINKTTRAVEEIIDDPDGPVEFGQSFYGITRDPNTGNLFINEALHGKAWRFDPSAPPDVAWTRIPLIEQITNPNVIYPFGYEVRPDSIFVVDPNDPNEIHGFDFGADSLGTLVFTNGFVWIGLTYNLDVDEFSEALGVSDQNFSGVVRVDPTTLEVTRVQIPGAGFIRGLNVDSSDPSIILVTDNTGDKVYRFDTNSFQVAQTFVLPPGSFPNHVDSDADSIYVALDRVDPIGEIAQIDRFTLQFTFLHTGSEFFPGTFSVFTVDDVLIWTDQNGDVGTINLNTLEPETFIRTGETSNHFGCIANQGEFWFASQGSVSVGIMPNSKFSVGGVKRPTSRAKGGSDEFARTGMAFGDPTRDNYDDQPPTFGEVLTSSGSLVVSAQIFDNVGVAEAKLIMGKKVYPMQPRSGNHLWWEAAIPTSDIPGSGAVDFTLTAKDFVGNSAEHNTSTQVSSGGGGGLRTSPGGSFIITPLTSGQPAPYSITATSLGPVKEEGQLSPQITIKNTGDEPLNNIRLMLSSELKGKFLLSDYAVKSVAPHSEYVISLTLNGKPNVDVMNNPIPYNGRIIISVDNKSPYVLELSGSIPNHSAMLQSMFMKMVENKAEQRYKTFAKPEQRIAQDATYEVTLGSGEKKIRSASDELIIRNTGDKALKNLRIMTSSLSDHFIVEQKNIELLPPSSFMKVKLVSKMNDIVPRDIHGELLVVPENGEPVTIPIDIVKKVQDDINTMYEVRTISGNDAISNTMDGIIIRNNSGEAINNVRVILPQSLARIFSLSEDSFRTIEPQSEKIIHLQMRGAHDSTVRQIMNNYAGDLIIASSDGMKKIIPIDIVWKRIASEHFMIYARDNTDELTKATQVVNFLERNYGEATQIFGDVNTKTTIYMTSSLDELSMLTDVLAPSTFIHDQDVAFVWSNSEDVNMLALREFSYRTIMQDHASYWIKQKISMDKGNWLVDGLADYVTASIVGERGMIKGRLDAFIVEQPSFEWYGAARTASEYGATYTLFKFLVDEYGESIIDKTLSNMESSMVSNHRCDTYEQCVLLKAVYDVQGLNMNDKRHDLSFDKIMNEWKGYLQQNYAINS